MVLPTHYYERIIEKLGGNPAQLPDRCECTMVDQIVNLIDNGIEGGGGGGGGAVFVIISDGNTSTANMTYDELHNHFLNGTLCGAIEMSADRETKNRYMYHLDMEHAPGGNYFHMWNNAYQDHTYFLSDGTITFDDPKG